MARKTGRKLLDRRPVAQPEVQVTTKKLVLQRLELTRKNKRLSKMCRSQINLTKLCMQRTRRKYDGSFTVRYGVLLPKLIHEFIQIIMHVKELYDFGCIPFSLD